MRPLISDERLKELDGYTRIYDTTNEDKMGMLHKSEYMRGMEMMRQEYEGLISSTREILLAEIKHRCPVCEKGRMPSQYPTGFYHNDATNSDGLGSWPYLCKSSITHHVAQKHNIDLGWPPPK